jgi:glycopeptide antibiotics resistance protein
MLSGGEPVGLPSIARHRQVPVSFITALQAELGRVLFMAAVVGLVVIVLAVVASLRRLGAMRTAALAARMALAVVLVGVGSLTLFGTEPLGQAERILILDPLQGAWGWDSIAWRPVIDNVAMFVPVGALVAAVWWRRSLVVVWLIALAMSLGIEAFQWLVPTGRVANMADLVANGFGALLGLGLAGLCRVRRGPRGARQPMMVDQPLSTSNVMPSAARRR